METVYRVSYYAGIQTLRLLHRIVRFLTFVFAPLRLIIRRLVTVFRQHRGRTLRAKIQTFLQYLIEAGRQLRDAWRQHPFRFFGVLWRLLTVAVRRYSRPLISLATAVVILLSGVLLYTTYRHWSDITFGLALTDADGNTWGYVADEAELQAGITMAMERMEKTVSGLDAMVTPGVSLHMVPQATLLTRFAICDELLTRTTASLREACGIYVDGVLYGAVVGRNNAGRMLAEILDAGRAGREGVTASFMNTVELVEGWYPPERIESVRELAERLQYGGEGRTFYQPQKKAETLTAIAKKVGVDEAVLRKLNPTIGEKVAVGQRILVQRGKSHLPLLVSGTMQYEIEVPYAVKRIADASQYEGYERIRTNGENGKNRVTATVTYLDGEPLFSEITSSDVIRKPVTEIIAYGTKKIDKNYHGGANATGRFMWPVPSTRFVSQYYKAGSGSARHNAIDIWKRNMTGETIVAADGGKVIVAEDPKGTSYWSYGKYIIIDHGGGYQTLYAHCHELFVKPGDTVIQGQKIATAGNTGRSTSPHLHFEIRKNGRALNPMKFF